jgi:hypothetical protein
MPHTKTITISAALILALGLLCGCAKTPPAPAQKEENAPQQQPPQMKLEEIRKAVIDAYNGGDGKKALELLAQNKDAFPAEEWQKLQDKISAVVLDYDHARQVLEIYDTATAKQKYEDIVAREDSEANFYRREALKFLAPAGPKSPEAKAVEFVVAGRKLIGIGDYRGALKCAAQADSFFPNGEKKPGNDIRMALNSMGAEQILRAKTLYKNQKVADAIEVLKITLEKHIYADDNEGGKIEDACRILLEAWQK